MVLPRMYGGTCAAVRTSSSLTGMKIPRELASVLERQRDVVNLVQAVPHLGAARVRWHVDSGRWQRPRRGVIVAHSGPLDAEQRLWVDLLSAGGEGDAVLAGLTAASLDGLRGFEPTVTYVLVPHERRPRAKPGILLRRSGHLGPEHVHPARMPPRTRLPRSLIDAASWAPGDDRARAVLAAGVQQRLVRPADLRATLELLPRVHRRRLITRTLDDIAGGAEALSELDFARLLGRFGLPQPTRQGVRRDHQRRRRWLDAVFERWRLVVEIDGRWHMEAATWWADMLRDNEITVDGYRVLRFPAHVVREQPELVARQITAALRVAGWRR